ncbi:MAG: hypothetical protein C4518_17700 [Desulfobacteraceae bacterium]|nr:MAG: hypothetical protein C4518_17700 [Desulfobacteraceae bacterium]
MIIIGLLFGCVLLMGIYLYPGHEPLQEESPQPLHKNVPDASLKKEPAPLVSPTDEARMNPPATAASSDANPYISYPENILELLNIDMEKMIKERDAFKNTVIHVEWMDHVNEVLKGLDPEKQEAIIKNHTTLLYIKDLLNQAYLSGKIDHDTFIKALADLMKWHQQIYQSMLTGAEYEALYGTAPEAANDIIDGLMESAPRYSFILNQQIPAEEVAKQVQGYKLEEVDSHFKKMILDRDQIGKKIGDGSMTLEQAREALQKSQQAFISRCKELLNEDEINTVFGSVSALETGGTQTKPPAVLGDSDQTELGFEIENPNTSIEMVKEKIDQDKLEDIKFFYEQRAKEREELITKLDAGEIKPDAVENVSNEMDAAFQENCRSTLTDEQYQLVFDNQEIAETNPPDVKDTQSTVETEGAVSRESVTPVKEAPAAKSQNQ